MRILWRSSRLGMGELREVVVEQGEESFGPGPASGWYWTQPAGTSSSRSPSTVPS